jgi:ParB-like chromosome segregation protein Spo0J
MAVERELTIATVALDDLVPDPANARTHDQRNLDAIRGSLARFGQVEPIVVQRGTRRIVGGHGRVEALRALGETHAAVVEVELDSTEATALAIALNRTAELAGWDDAALAALLESLPGDLADVAGFSEAELGALLDALRPDPQVVEDDVPEPLAEAVTRPGDLWLLGDHRLLCGDSTDPHDVSIVRVGW